MNVVIKELETHNEYEQLVKISTTSISNNIQICLENQECSCYRYVEFSKKHCKIFVAYVDSTPVGIISKVQRLIENKFQPVIDFIIVDTLFQKNKIGTMLLNYLENYLKSNDKNYKFLFVQTNTSEDFYIKNNFQIISKNLEKYSNIFDCKNNKIFMKSLL